MNFKDFSRISDFLVCGKANSMKGIPEISRSLELKMKEAKKF